MLLGQDRTDGEVVSTEKKKKQREKTRKMLGIIQDVMRICVSFASLKDRFSSKTNL